MANIINEVVVNGNTYKLETDTSEIEAQLTAEDDLQFQFSKSGTNYGYLDADGNFVPFKNPTGTKSITANGTYDVTDYASVNVSSRPSSVTSTGSGSATSGCSFSATIGSYYLVHVQQSADRVYNSFSVTGATIIGETPVTSTNDGSNRQGSGRAAILKATSSTIKVTGGYVSACGYGKINF